MRMIDVSGKDITLREAIVEGKIFLKTEVIEKIKNKDIPKGDVLEAAKIAGILAAKKTPETLPLCHPIPIESVKIEFTLNDEAIVVCAYVKGRARTGVEMEAFCAASAACLTIYDMCKMFDREAVISDIKLIKKSGGKSGDYERK